MLNVLYIYLQRGTATIEVWYPVNVTIFCNWILQVSWPLTISSPHLPTLPAITLPYGRQGHSPQNHQLSVNYLEFDKSSQILGRIGELHVGRWKAYVCFALNPFLFSPISSVQYHTYLCVLSEEDVEKVPWATFVRLEMHSEVWAPSVDRAVWIQHQCWWYQCRCCQRYQGSCSQHVDKTW